MIETKELLTLLKEIINELENEDYIVNFNDKIILKNSLKEFVFPNEIMLSSDNIDNYLNEITKDYPYINLFIRDLKLFFLKQDGVNSLSEEEKKLLKKLTERQKSNWQHFEDIAPSKSSLNK